MTPLTTALPGLAPGAAGAERRLVIIDQDGSGPADSNQMSMMVLLLSG
jgi:hypothetical protein